MSKAKKDWIEIGFTSDKRVKPQSQQAKFFYEKSRELWRRGFTLAEARIKVPAAYEAKKRLKKARRNAPAKDYGGVDVIALANNSRHQVNAARFQAAKSHELDGYLDDYQVFN